MNESIEKMKIIIEEISSKRFEILFFGYFSDDKYINYFIKQYISIYKNVLSIDSLIKIGNIEDAYTIFRKYIETYIIMNCIIENPNIASKYLIHDKFLSYKANNNNKYDIKDFCKDKPEGFIQYGFISDIIEIKDDSFRYTIREVAKAGKIEDYYDWYRLSNNFVHNNTTNLNIDISLGTKKLINLINVSTDRFINKIKEIIKKLS